MVSFPFEGCKLRRTAQTSRLNNSFLLASENEVTQTLGHPIILRGWPNRTLEYQTDVIATEPPLRQVAKKTAALSGRAVSELARKDTKETG